MSALAIIAQENYCCLLFLKNNIFIGSPKHYSGSVRLAHIEKRSWWLNFSSIPDSAHK
jgi:hypothetical protein